MGMGHFHDKRYGFGANGGDRVWGGVILVMHVDERRREMGLLGDAGYGVERK